MMEYILVIDAGATKTIGQLRSLDGVVLASHQVGPGSLTYDFDMACQNFNNLISEVLEQSKVKLDQVFLMIAAAGAGNEDKRAKLMGSLDIGFGQLEVVTDARASLYGAASGKPVIAVAVGTGIAAMRLDDEGNERIFGGWGFTVADQGSGAWMGKKLVSTTLELLDIDQAEDPLSQSVFSIIGRNRSEIIQWFNKATPDSYARFTSLLTENADINERAYDVLKQAAAGIERLIFSALDSKAYPVVIMGGLADTIKPYLSDIIQAQLVATEGSALDGAFILAADVMEKE